MPPIKSIDLFKKPKSAKNRTEFSEKEEQMMLLRQLYIDVNDPRNEDVIRLLKETKNEYLVRLLTQDSRNMLADEEPFRHKLLKARNKDVTLANVFIPLLEAEIIDSSRTSFFLSHLETLFREEAYITHLNKRAKLEGTGAATIDPNAEFRIVDLERRRIIYDQIKEAQHNKRHNNTHQTNKYKSVVNEFEIPLENPFVGLL